jgi:hypothetical protein
MERPIHATDREVGPGQLRATAICGLRVSRNSVLRADRWNPADFTCVGCRAILVERQKEHLEDLRKAGIQ